MELHHKTLLWPHTPTILHVQAIYIDAECYLCRLLRQNGWRFISAAKPNQSDKKNHDKV